jgi:hypothetical protein
MDDSALSGRTFFRILHERFGVPWLPSVKIVRAVKTIKAPVNHVRRRFIAAQATRHPAFVSRIEWASGYWRFGADELFGSQSVVAACNQIYDLSQNNTKAKASKKQFLVNILDDTYLNSFPEIFGFVLSPQILEIVADYFKSAPILCWICLYLSPVNNTEKSSQKFHLDTEDTTQLKLFLNVRDHPNEDFGPFTFYPAIITENILRSSGRLYNPRGAFDDHAAFSASGGQQPLQLTGPPGSGAFVDTSRCLHFGSRGNRKERLMLMVQYAPHNLALNPGAISGLADRVPWAKSNPLQWFAVHH